MSLSVRSAAVSPNRLKDNWLLHPPMPQPFPPSRFHLPCLPHFHFFDSVYDPWSFLLPAWEYIFFYRT